MGSKRVMKELNAIEDASTCYSATIVDDDIFHWQASINGPEDSPYEGGIFRLDIRIPRDFPLNPPQIRFKTKIYHPNIHLTGAICLNILQSQWNSTCSIEYLLSSIRSLLTDANSDDPYNARAALYHREDRQKFDEIAKWWTKKYAM
jgi:ubiquitin-conjugating enzyme E2 D/E